MPGKAELEEVFQFESERSISNDWVVRYENRLFQLQAQSRNYAPAKGRSNPRISGCSTCVLIDYAREVTDAFSLLEAI
jgi:hypothetical protein